jgi:hypothetical protein
MDLLPPSPGDNFSSLRKATMKRVHLFEFEDFSWFPDSIRKGITDYIQFLANTGNMYEPVMPLIKKGIEKSRSRRIVDICSGGGGGIKKISEYLRKEDIEAKIILTDKFPNLPAFIQARKETKERIEFIHDSIDATQVPEWLSGFRTQFVSFHHFKPNDARNILSDASKKNEPIGIFEYTDKSFTNVLFCLLAPVLILLVTPFIRPMSFKKIFFTYIIPAIPFFTMWDGFVSILRTYSIKEMKEMTDSLQKDGYVWEVGKVKVKGPLNVLYLMGYPETKIAVSEEKAA